MREATADRLERYLRVAYDGAEGTTPPALAPASRRPRARWAVPMSAAARIAAVLLVLAVAGVTLLLLSRGAAPPAAPTAEPAPMQTPTALSGSGESPTEPAAMLVVHVAGAVEQPGVRELPAGSRVTDAISAAGGATDAADLDVLNLAAPVVDGQQVYVPERGEMPPPSTATQSAPGSATALVNINTADQTALETLPGIGPSLAQRIVDHRTEHGPFASVESLTDVSGIGPATMERIADLVTV